MDVLTTIRSRREEISKNITALQAEDSELAVAEKVITRLAPISGDGGSSSPREGQPPRQIDFVVKTLAHMPQRWAPDWTYLQTAIMNVFGVEIPKSSLQPYLSHLKNDGVIVRDGPKIALKSRVAKGAGPHSDGSYDPSTAAADEDDDRTPASLERQSLQDAAIKRSRELDAVRRRNIRNVEP